jgi:hypothetical protein
MKNNIINIDVALNQENLVSHYFERREDENTKRKTNPDVPNNAAH